MYVDTRDIYCEACGYNLRDKRSGECQECGATFDRDTGIGYQDTPPDPIGQWLLRNGRLFSIGFSLILLAATLFLYWQYRDPAFVYIALPIATLAFVDLVIYFLRSQQHKG